ncbi:MAG: glycosyltransferase family 39 protein [Microgenomates group bacterium]
MIRKLSLNKKLLFVFLVSFTLFLPSLFTFYTHDDFFHLKISKVNTLTGFFNFFNFTQGPEGLGVYRPLTTQVFYFLGNSLFHLNPLPLHIISFLTFFLVIFLVYKLVSMITKNQTISLISAFLYATSATHFGHLYYLATYQELGLALFFLLTVIFFVKFVYKGNIKYYFLSLITYILALLSKETAVVLPAILILVYGFLKLRKEKHIPLKKFVFALSPFLILLFIYLYFHFFLYGLAQGESYIWDFSPRFINTLFWYGLWSFNLPETLVDFVGPGLRFNPNLFKFWSKDIIPIFFLFGGFVIFILSALAKARRKMKKKDWQVFVFSFAWFVLTLIPVLFLPLHKFAFYLTLPLVGVVLAVSYLIEKAKVNRILKIILASVWIFLTLFTLRLTVETHWITQGAKVARNAHLFFRDLDIGEKGKMFIEFYDTKEDEDLPWGPSDLVKVVLSQDNFFEVFFEEKFELLKEGSRTPEQDIIKVRARSLLNY